MQKKHNRNTVDETPETLRQLQYVSIVWNDNEIAAIVTDRAAIGKTVFVMRLSAMALSRWVFVLASAAAQIVSDIF